MSGKNLSINEILDMIKKREIKPEEGYKLISKLQNDASDIDVTPAPVKESDSSYRFAESVQETKVSPLPVSGGVQAPAAGDLVEHVGDYLKGVLSQIIALPADRINTKQPLEKYGVDSVIIMEMNNSLEKDFGELPKTLLFEYSNLHDLAGYFAKNHEQRVKELLGIGEERAQVQAAAAVAIQPLPRAQESAEEVGYDRFRFFNEDININIPKAQKQDEDIAIIGVSGMFPEAKDLDEFWENLKGGRDCIIEIPPERWDHSKLFDPQKGKKGKVYSKWGGFMEYYDCFDPLFFQMTPKDAEMIDPQERLFMENVHATIEDAGYTRTSLSATKTGVFVGVMYGHYQLFGAEESLKGNVMALASSYASIANRVSYYFNFSGPSIAMDTMCSSSLTALHLACESIQRGDSELAIAGGVNVTIHPDKYLFLCSQRFASSEGRCRAFGDGGDGYVPGEGVGSILLKPLSKAQADRDYIYGVIKATSVNHGGKTNGYTVPNPNAQAALISDALRKAKINPRTISYIEAHGTGTALGDPIEITGISKAYREHTQDKQYCSIGSVKSNVGHLESAAGIASITKVLLQMKNKQLVPSILSEKLNPNLNFKDSPFYVQHELEEWKQPVIKENGAEKKYPRRAGISSFGAGGANVHILMEEYEKPLTVHDKKAQGTSIFVLSAKNEERLKVYVEKIIRFINKNTVIDNIDIVDLTYTLQVGREPLDERIAIIVSDISEIKEKLEAFIQGQRNIENLFRGNVKNSKTDSEMFLDGEEGEEFIKNIISRKKYNKLCYLWVSGADIDWNVLYMNYVPTRMPLPTYPFERTRYWYPKNENSGKDITCLKKTEVLHPIIDSNESTLEEQCYRKQLSTEDFFIRDHVVSGNMLLPGVAYLEMAWGAGSLATRKSKVARLRNIAWTRPVELDEDTKEIYISLYPDEDHVEYDISSYTSSGSKLVHSKGKLEYESLGYDEEREEYIDIEGIKARCSHTMNGEECYDRFDRMGLHYGPTFRSVKEFHGGEGEALSRLQLPNGLSQDFGSFTIHPSLADGAMQTAAGLLLGKDSEVNTPYVPFALSEVEVLKPLTEICYSYVSLAVGEEASNSEVKKFDIVLADNEGRTAVKLKGFSGREFKQAGGSVPSINVGNGAGNKRGSLDELLQKLENGELDADEVERLMEVM